MKKIFFTLLFILLCTPKIASMTQEGSVLGIQQTDSIYINLEKFTYDSPSASFIEHIINRNTKKEYSDSDDYKHYEMKTNEEKEAYKLIGNNINGLILVNTTFMKDIIKYIDDNPKVKTALINLWKENDLAQKYDCKDWNTYYKFLKDHQTETKATAIAVNGNWQYYQCLSLATPMTPPKIPTDFIIEGLSSITSVFSSFSQALSDGIFNVKFAAGMAKEKKEGITDKTIKYYKDHFGKTVDPDNKIQAVFSKDHMDLILSQSSSYFASGACYEANPSGHDNRCVDALSGECKTGKNKLDGQVYFVFGVSCKSLNSFIADSNYKAKILNNPKSMPKEKIEVKIQVPFDGITDGISISKYINNIYKYLVTIGLFLSGLMLIIGGFQYITQTPKEGKKNIQNSIIGIVLLLSSYTLLKTVNPNIIELKEIQDIKEVEQITTDYDFINTADIDIPNNKLNEQFDPKIEVKEDWCFPVKKSHVNVSSFKNSLVYTGGGAFGYNRTRDSHKKKYPNATICHAGLDIFTNYITAGKDECTKETRNGDGTVIAIADGTVIAKGYAFTTCGKYGKCKQYNTEGYKVGSIIVNHGDFTIRYGEVNNDSSEHIKVKQSIKAGQVLGKATHCGMLHLEIFAKGKSSGGNWFPNHRFEKSDTVSCLKKEMTVDYKKNPEKYCKDQTCYGNWQQVSNLQDPTNFLKELYKKDQPAHCGTETGKQ